MKKCYLTPEYKQKSKRLMRYKQRNHKKRRKVVVIAKRHISIQTKRISKKQAYNSTKTVEAPTDLRIIENTESCLVFIKALRSTKHINTNKNRKFVSISLSNVEKIDYGMISILTAICDDLKSHGVYLKANFPNHLPSKKFIIDSGFLNQMYDLKGNPFPKAAKSDFYSFEKGSGILSEQTNKIISNTIKNVVEHLTGIESQCKGIKTVILEICGNSIEWSGTKNKQWLLGVKFEDEKVIFTVADVGNGILQTIKKKFSKQVNDLITLKKENQILKRAFEQKYGSTTEEINRNKGLLSIKSNYEKGVLKNLKVLTNNVILHFDNDTLSETFPDSSFNGTFYQWEMTAECLNNITLT